MSVLGVDPGGRSTGLCLVTDRARYVDHRVVQRHDDWDLFAYIDKVMLAAEVIHMDVGPELQGIAVEAVVAPRAFKDGKLQLLNPGALIDTSAVFGAFAAWVAVSGSNVWFLDVPPRGNGKGPLMSYPRALVGERERAGGGILRHARAAMDVAIYAVNQHRVRLVK